MELDDILKAGAPESYPALVAARERVKVFKEWAEKDGVKVLRETDILCLHCKKANYVVQSPGSESARMLHCPNQECLDYHYFMGMSGRIHCCLGASDGMTEVIMQRMKDALNVSEPVLKESSTDYVPDGYIQDG